MFNVSDIKFIFVFITLKVENNIFFPSFYFIDRLYCLYRVCYICLEAERRLRELELERERLDKELHRAHDKILLTDKNVHSVQVLSKVFFCDLILIILILFSNYHCNILLYHL